MRTLIAVGAFFLGFHALGEDLPIRVRTIEDARRGAETLRRTTRATFVEARLGEARRSGRALETIELTALLNHKFRMHGGDVSVGETAIEASQYRSVILREGRIARDRSYYSLDDDPELFLASIGVKSIAYAVPIMTRRASTFALANETVKQIHDRLEEHGASRAQFNAQLTRANARDLYWNRGRDTLSEWWDNCDKYRSARELDRHLFFDFEVPVHAGLLDMVDHMPQLSRKVVRQMAAVTPDGEVFIPFALERDPAQTLSEVQDTARTHVTRLAKEAKARESTAGDDDVTSEEEREQAMRDDRTARNLDQWLNDAESAVMLISQFTDILGDSRTARIIKVSGKSSLSITRAVRKFVSEGSKGKTLASKIFGTVNMTGAILGAVGEFISLFGGSGPDLAVVLEEIGHLKEMIITVRDEMHGRFDFVDRNINRVYDTMIVGFTSLEADIRRGNAQLSEIAGVLRSFDEAFQSLQGSLYAYLRAGFRQEIQVEENLCTDEEHFDRHRSREAVWDCFTRIYTYATANARDDLATRAGEPVTARTLKAIAHDRAFDVVNPWENIGLLSQFASSTFDYHRLSGPSKPLVNAREWLRFATLYMKLASRWPDFYRQYGGPVDPATNEETGAHAMTNAILSAGEDLSRAIHNLTTVETSNGPVADTSFYQQLFDLYRSKFDALSDEIAAKRHEWEAANPVLDGYDIWKGADQMPHRAKLAVSFSQSEIGLCEGVEVPYLPREKRDTLKLPLPSYFADPYESEDATKKLLAHIPAPFLIAHHLGLGIIRICVENVSWADERRFPAYMSIAPDGGKDYSAEKHLKTSPPRGRVQYTIRATIEKTGESIPIFIRRFESFHDYVKTYYHLKDGKPYENPVMHDAHYHLARTGNPDEDEIKKLEDRLRTLSNNGTESLLKLAVMWEWENTNRKQFETTPAYHVKNEARENALAEITARVNQRLRTEYGARFNEVLRDEMAKSGRVSTAADELTGAKRVLITFIALGFPSSIENNDELRSLLFGAERIIDGLDIANGKLDDERSLADDAEGTMAAEFQARGNALMQWIKFQRPTPGSERYEALEIALGGLRLMKALHAVSRPKADVQVSLGALRQLVDEFLQKRGG